MIAIREELKRGGRRKYLRTRQITTLLEDKVGAIGARFEYKPIEVGMIGCGGMMGPYHTEDLQHGRISVVTSLYDLEKTARDIAARFAVPNAFFLKEIKGNEGPTALKEIEDYNRISLDACLDNHRLSVLSGPNNLHVEQAKYILGREDAGERFLYIEKPPSNSLEGAMELAELERQHPGQIGIVSQNRLWDMVLEARYLISQGAIGDIQDFRIEYQQDWMNEGTPAVWRTMKGIGGEKGSDDDGNIGKLMDIAYHATDTIQFVTGMDISHVLRSHIKNVIRERDPDPGSTFGAKSESKNKKVSVGGETEYHGDDVMETQLELEGGATGSMKVAQTNAGNGNMLKFQIYGSKGRIEFTTDDPEHLQIYDFSGNCTTRTRDPNQLEYRKATLPRWLRDGMNMDSPPFQYHTPPMHGTGWRDVHRKQAQAWALYSQLVSQGVIGKEERDNLYIVPTAAEALKVMQSLKAIYEAHKAQKDYRLSVKDMGR